MLLLIAGCSGGGEAGPTPEPTLSPEEIEAKNQRALEEAVMDAMGTDLAPAISSVDSMVLEDEYYVMVRTVATGGAYFLDVIESAAPAFFEMAEDLGVTAAKFEVMEYSESNAGDIEHMISWTTEDGTTGIYMNGNTDEVDIRATLDDLRGYLEEEEQPALPGADTDFGADLDVFQGEWATEYSKVIVNGNTFNVVHLDIFNENVVESVFTYYFVYDEAGALVVVDDVGRRYCMAAVDEAGRLVCEHESELLGTKTYEKVSDNTVVPEVTKDPAIGMTEWDVYQSTWGFPKDRNKTTTAYGVSEQWVYDKGYIYFEDGKVTAIQEK